MSLSFAIGLILSSAANVPDPACRFDTEAVSNPTIIEAVPAGPDGDTVEASGVPSSVPLPDPELAEIRGTQIPVVGLDQVDAATWATSISADTAGTAPSGLNRDIVDNWNFSVASTLILDGINQARPM